MKGEVAADMASQRKFTDAYEYAGALDDTHPAVVAGLTGTTSDDELDHILARLLLTHGEPPFDITTLGPALVTWREDLLEMGE